jgi:hypothetical protein
MSLQDLGSLGEFVGAIAVVVTLGYLAVQIRQNTRSVRTATYQSTVTSTGELMMAAARDVQLSRIWRIGIQGQSGFDEDERTQFNFLMTQLFNQWENMFILHRESVIEDSWWRSRIPTLRYQLSLPGVSAWWGRRHDTLYTEEFRDFVRELQRNDPESV